jgi:glycogen synthase
VTSWSPDYADRYGRTGFATSRRLARGGAADQATTGVRRVFYACGPGNAIEAHKNWRSAKPYPGEFSITYSSLVEDLCQELGAHAYLVSHDATPKFVTDGTFTVEHRPKRGEAKGRIGYLARECSYAVSLVASAVKYRADVAIVSSGTTLPFCLWLFRLAGIPVVAVLHNSLWPRGHRSKGGLQRAMQWLDSTFWRWGVSGVVGVSPECIRQVGELRGSSHDERLQVMRPLYDRARVSPPPPRKHSDGPFRIVFFGRVVRNKGVFDILDIASRVEQLRPGQVRWEIWGDGPDLEELRAEHERTGLGEVVRIGGWAAPKDQMKIYARAHASIVPSRSDFAEGLAKTAVESVLAGRPVITNPVVPALDVLRPACVEARTDDIQSYVDAVTALQSNAALYEELQRACTMLAGEFYERDRGLGARLKSVLTSASILRPSVRTLKNPAKEGARLPVALGS